MSLANQKKLLVSTSILDPDSEERPRSIRPNARTGTDYSPDSDSNAAAFSAAEGTSRGWSNSTSKRLFDVVVALLSLVILSPFLLLTAIAVKLSSRGALLFRQTRMGKGGRHFTIYKFRTMRQSADEIGPSVTKAGDNRLTPIGGMLRRLKLDELPQLVNVLRGDMSLVGARPKLPHHQRFALDHRPGITGAASLAFRNEEELLHRIAEEALDAYQVNVLMPLKTDLDNQYMWRATFFTDLRLLFNTALNRGSLIAEHDLLRFHQSLVSLNSALTSSQSPLTQSTAPVTEIAGARAPLDFTAQ